MSESKHTPIGRPLEWNQDNPLQWTDRHHGFCIVVEPDDELPFVASWGEGDSEQFLTLGEARAWCQQQLDGWVARFAVMPDLSAEAERLRADLAAMTADRDSWADQAEQRVADWDDEQRRCAGALEALGAERRKVGGLAAEVERLRTIVPEALEKLNDELCDENAELRRKVEALREAAMLVVEADGAGALTDELVGNLRRAALAASQKGGTT